MHLGLHRKRMQNGYSPYGRKQYPPQHYRVTAILSSHRHPLSSRRMCVLRCRGQALVFLYFFFFFLCLPKKSNKSLIMTENRTALQSQLCTFFTIACSLSKMMGLTLDVRACLHTTLLWNQRHGEEEGGGEVGERREGEEREVFQLASETFQGRCFKTNQFVIRPRVALFNGKNGQTPGSVYSDTMATTDMWVWVSGEGNRDSKLHSPHICEM